MIITLCGSNKFKSEIHRLANYLYENGFYVHIPAEFNSDINEESETFYYIQKGLLLGHFRKIDQANVVVICNFNGYIGNSTAMELAYAFAKNKFIIALTESKEMAHNVCITEFCDTYWADIRKLKNIKNYGDEICDIIKNIVV